MSTQTLHQGSLRPTRVPAITVVHPGLQVHSIAAPKTDRRLSFLMSANLYCAFAAGVVLVAQAAPTIHKPWVTADPPTVLVELMPPEVAPSVVPPSIPAIANNLQSHAADAPTTTEPQAVPDTNVLPTTIGTTDLSQHTAANSAATNGTGHNPVVGTLPPGTITQPWTGQPTEVSFNSVSILHQIQPIYPSLARLAHKQGDVVLIMTINEQGVPTNVQMDSGDAIFKSDAIRAAQQWRFTPARIDGQPRSARFRLTLQFRLRG